MEESASAWWCFLPVLTSISYREFGPEPAVSLHAPRDFACPVLIGFNSSLQPVTHVLDFVRLKELLAVFSGLNLVCI